MSSYAHARAIGFTAVSTLLLSGVAGDAMSSDIPGHWSGELEFRGAEMPLRIHVEARDDSLRATLDLPGLILAWEPMAATPTETGAELELPFGLGALAVEPSGDEIHAMKTLAGDTLTLRLERAAPPPYDWEEVRFPTGDTYLAGTLTLPSGEGPHPAVVLLHGSGREGRHKWEYSSWADLLARQGLAVLMYDKRGVGASGGEDDPGIQPLTEDGAAAVRYLRSRPEVDPRRIGLKGLSQGAWVAEQIAADLGDVAFLLLVSAAASTPREQELQKIEYGMRADGRPEAEIEDALAYAGLYFYVARTGEGWPLLERAIRRAQQEEWGQYVDQPRSESDFVWWRENHDFQPAVAVQELDLPVLLLYGGADWITPPIENAQKLRGLFPAPEKVEVHVFPGADHRLEIGAGPDADGDWQWPRSGPDTPGTVMRWLERTGLTQPPRSFEGGLFTSDRDPSMQVRIAPGFEYLGRENFLLGETHGVERHHWVQSDAGEVTAIVVFQFEKILDGVEGQYTFNVPPAEYIAGSNYRFAPDPVRLGSHDYVHNTWAFDTRASAAENPGKESDRTLKLLAANGYRIEDELIMSRFVRAVGEEQRKEVIFFYMEPLSRHGHTLSEFPEGGPRSDDYDRVSATVDARALEAFRVNSPDHQ